MVSLLALVVATSAPRPAAQGSSSGVARFPLPASGLTLQRTTRAGAFVDVVGRQSALLGYEHGSFEAWVYPLKLLDDLQVDFSLSDYPLAIRGSDVLRRITATPEATTLVYSHAAFTVRQVMTAPLQEGALVLLFDVDTRVPLGVTISFRPRLRLMWPGGLQTGNIGWNPSSHLYEITEESGRFAGVIGSPAARQGSLMPYQEEPRDVPVQLTIEPGTVDTTRMLVPVVIAGSVEGAADARATYDRVLGSIPALMTSTADHYRTLIDGAVAIDTPDDRVDEAYRWAIVGVDKGVATNPFLGTGLLAGFRTSGDSERPGFAWFFGRDALWTTLAIDAYGDVTTAREALAFLRKYQRDDGKIPHEISQSATLLPWFTDLPYAWASADSTPLFLVAHEDYWRASGDTAFVRDAWPALVKAWRFSEATDTDGNALIENTKVGHGWVEGGALYPPHEELYLQGVWAAAQRAMVELAEVVGDREVARAAAGGAGRTIDALERTYWQPDRHAYAYATKLPRTARVMAEPGPYLERRQQRLDAIAQDRLYDERTVLSSVPMWWRVLDPAHADEEIDSIGSGSLATDWGHRILSDRSALYDPLSYHYGSVWPLFTGWASVGAYRYGRSQVGYQALMANALLYKTNALGYVTELLSGDFQAPFGRSSHHQIWSEAMVISPIVRGLFGLDTARESSGAVTLTVAPQVPADWRTFTIQNVPLGGGRVDIRSSRTAAVRTIAIEPRGASQTRNAEVELIVSVPFDGAIERARVNRRPLALEQLGTRGDVRQARVRLIPESSRNEVTFSVREGSDVYREIEAAPSGAANRGLRVLRSRAATDGLHLRLEGIVGQRYPLRVRSPRRLGALPAGVTMLPDDGGDPAIEVAFEGAAGTYVRRDVVLPLR